MGLADLLSAFVLGLLTPLGAVCVLPLYPGFLAFLSKQASGDSSNKKAIILSGVYVTLGVISFMALLGIIFTSLLEISLTNVVEIVSPVAYAFLAVVSILMIFGVNIGKIFPQFHSPVTKHPAWSAFLFGFFFGAIVLPCNPGFIAALFAQVITSVGFYTNFLAFIFFGIGMSAPLLLFSVISGASSKVIIGFLTNHEKWILRISGIIMLIISVYFLSCDFNLLPLSDGFCSLLSIG